MDYFEVVPTYYYGYMYWFSQSATSRVTVAIIDVISGMTQHCEIFLRPKICWISFHIICTLIALLLFTISLHSESV